MANQVSAMPKSSLRNHLLCKRLELKAQDCLRMSSIACQRLSETREFAAAATVALYSPVRNEVSTEEVFGAAKIAGKRVAYPRICGDHLDFYAVHSLEQLSPGEFGIPEPEITEPLSLKDIDLMVLPGTGFDLQGHRLGYGRGYYDRVLTEEKHRPTLVGLSFEQQVVEALPRDPHDVRVDLLVTEMQTRRFSP